ncbi:MAG: phosphodiester glycosidase family protein [Clostridia bacterium]|nr:phosphodiester glycosidase family protein [Clostridia bacterium]
MKKHLIGIIYGFLLTAFTVYLLLDTFVIVRIYDRIPNEDTEYDTTSDTQFENTETYAPNTTDSAIESEIATTAAELTEPIITENSYLDNNISVTLTDYRKYNTTIHVADIKITSPEYLKTALAKDSYGKNVTEKTSKIADRNNAIIAVNGDFYGSQEKGFVLRNGVLYRSSASKNQEDLVIYKDGYFGIVTETEASAEQLLDDGAVHILSFGPALVIDGEITVDEDDEVKRSMTSNPRTAIGIIEKGHYILLTSDGRTDENEGLSLIELAKFMQSLGAKIAYNLDGGGSSTMYFCGEIVNNPTTNGSYKERSVSDIVYIGY